MSAIHLKEFYDNLFLVSKLYLKIKNKDKAIYFARKAKEMIKNMAWNSQEADDLFKESEIN